MAGRVVVTPGELSDTDNGLLSFQVTELNLILHSGG